MITSNIEIEFILDLDMQQRYRSGEFDGLEYSAIISMQLIKDIRSLVEELKEARHKDGQNQGEGVIRCPDY